MLQQRRYTENCLCKQGNIVIRYIEVDFTFGLPDFLRYIEEFVTRFVISRFYSIHFAVTFAGTTNNFATLTGRVISRTSLNRDSLNRGSTKLHSMV